MACLRLWFWEKTHIARTSRGALPLLVAAEAALRNLRHLPMVAVSEVLNPAHPQMTQITQRIRTLNSVLVITFVRLL
jgi:hypothetical protein